MHVSRRFVVAGALVLLSGVSPLVATAQAPAHVSSLLSAVKLGCNTLVAGSEAHCYATALGRGNQPAASSSPTGLGPADIQSAYKLTGLSGAGRTVAIVDA